MKYKDEIGQPSEDQEQIAVVKWFQLKFPNYMYHASPNGGSRNIIEAIKLKKMGCSPGFPDLFFPYPNHPYNGLFIEMKRKKGSIVSPSQEKWITFLNRVGFYAKITYGFDETIKIIEEYFINI